MATTLTGIHKANDSNGFMVSFQIDYVVGQNHTEWHITHSSPGRMRETEIDVPLSEIPEVIKTLTQVLENAAVKESWCGVCMGSGEVPINLFDPTESAPCEACGGRGIARG